MSSAAQDELQRLLGVEKPASEKPATDPRFEHAQAEEHGVTSIKPTEHLNSLSAELARVIVRVRSVPSDRQVPALLEGISELVRAARKEGPAIVEHLACELHEGAEALISEVLAASKGDSK